MSNTVNAPEIGNVIETVVVRGDSTFMSDSSTDNLMLNYLLFFGAFSLVVGEDVEE